MADRQTIGDATVDDLELQQPAPGSGAPQLAHDGRAYWRAEAARWKKRALRAEEVCRQLTANDAELRGVFAELRKVIDSLGADGST